jgi:3-oxoacyl-[acyl-carrier-protein] synthase II
MTAATDRVVITGVGVTTPLGDGLATLWQRLCSGATAVRDWSDLAAEGYRCTRACRIEALPAPALRRGAALALAAAEQAVAEARLTLPATCGVYIGSTLGESEAFEQAAAGADVDVVSHMVPSFASAVRRRYQLDGPEQSIATACAAGNYAVGAALAALRRGRVDLAIAGGVEPFSRLSMVGFSRSRAMAADLCRPFDARRSGMLLGEGAALFVLERAPDALRRGVRPLAEVVALGLSCDAHHPTAPQPEGLGMRAAMQAALDAAGLGPRHIDWVNAHGSGTRASDSAEARALHSLFGPVLPPVSASKGALGHALGAASAIELAICVEGLRAQAVPPTAGHEVADSEFAIHCATTPQPRPVDWVMNNAFAFGGLNSALLLRHWTP